MQSIQLLLPCYVVLTFAGGAFQVLAQETKSAPIYLDEPEPEPPASVAARQPVKDTYKDKSIRTEREIVKLSNDKIVNDGKFIEYYRNGQKYVEGVYKMGVFDGAWKYWFPNGQLRKQVTFKNGKPDGQWEEFNKEGKRTAQKSYQRGKRHGKWINFHEGGEQSRYELSYDQGVPVGERISYFESGKKFQTVGFKDGKMDGPMTEWDESGEKRAVVTFKAGKLIGKVQRFDKK